jgi:hypothetical protein
MSREAVHLLIPLAEIILGGSESIFQSGNLPVRLSPLEPVNNPIRLGSFGRVESPVDGMRRVDHRPDVRDDIRFRREVEEAFRRRDPSLVLAKLVREKGVIVLFVLVELGIVGASVVSAMDSDIAFCFSVCLPERLAKTSRVRPVIRLSSNQRSLTCTYRADNTACAPRASGTSPPVCPWAPPTSATAPPPPPRGSGGVAGYRE